MKKLQRLKGKIKEWNKVSFCNLDIIRSELEMEVEVSDKLEEDRLLNQDEKKARNEAKHKLWEISQMEEMEAKIQSPLVERGAIRILNFFIEWLVLEEGLTTLERSKEETGS